MISVNDRVCQGFAQCAVNIALAPRNAAALLNQEHELIDEGRNAVSSRKRLTRRIREEVCHALRDFARRLLVRYRAGHVDGANEPTIILRIYSVAAKLVPRFYKCSSMYCSQQFSFSVHCEHRAEKQTGHVASCLPRSQKSATRHAWGFFHAG
jgi:hypothetical protein